MSEIIGMDLFGEQVLRDQLLADKFLAPPFTVLNTMSGDWQKRKRKWVGLGIRSDIGRDVKTMPKDFGKKYGRKEMTQISIFDPALCELMYRWFLPKDAHVLDPFCGGSVRGLVACYLGNRYTGIDIRQEQITANEEQAEEILVKKNKNRPTYLVGDSNVVLDSLKPEYDFVFSCPPYHDLEVYSDDKCDISNMDYKHFIKAYSSIITKAVTLLKPNRFAVFVVGDVRDKNGFYKGFYKDTIDAFVSTGIKFYNDVVYTQPLGTAMLRANRIFTSGRKLIKVHENILVFYKGDPKLIKEIYPVIGEDVVVTNSYINEDEVNKEKE